MRQASTPIAPDETGLEQDTLPTSVIRKQSRILLMMQGRLNLRTTDLA